MRPEASLVMAGTMFASGLLFAVSGPGHTLDWGELGLLGGAAGALVSLPLFVRMLAGRPPASIPLFWKGVALLVLFGFWFSAALALNTAWSWSEPIDRVAGTVTDKRVSRGRYGDSHYAQVATRRGPVEAGMPRDVWSEVAVGQQVEVLLCRGVLGYPYVVTPLEREPYLDVKRLLGLRGSETGLRC